MILFLVWIMELKTFAGLEKNVPVNGSASYIQLFMLALPLSGRKYEVSSHVNSSTFSRRM